MSDLPVDCNGCPLGWAEPYEDRDGLVAESYDLAPPPAVFTAPEFLDPREHLRVEDQGRIGSCSGNATTTVEELVAFYQTGQRHEFSRMGAYLAAQKIDGLLGRDAGATISGQARRAKQYGTAPESVFPYPTAYTATIPDAYWAAAEVRQTRSTTKLRSYQEVFDFLARGIGGVVIGIPWKASLANAQSGVIEQSSGQNYGGHALAIIGYLPASKGGRSDRQGRPYLIMQNSHGLRWANKGCALIAPPLFDEWGRDGYSEMIGFSDMENPNDENFVSRWWTGDRHPLA